MSKNSVFIKCRIFIILQKANKLLLVNLLSLITLQTVMLDSGANLKKNIKWVQKYLRKLHGQFLFYYNYYFEVEGENTCINTIHIKYIHLVINRAVHTIR